MRDWRGIRAEIGDRVFYATADGVRQPRLHEAWIEEVGETHIRIRPTASPFGEMIGNDHQVRWLHRPAHFVVVKGHGFICPGPVGPCVRQITSSIGPSSRTHRPELSCEHSLSVEYAPWTV